MRLGLGSWDLTLFCGRWHNSRCLFFREGSLCTSDVDIHTDARGPASLGVRQAARRASTHRKSAWGTAALHGAVGTPGFHPALCCVTRGQRPLTSCLMHNLQQGPRTPWVHARVALHTVRQGLRLPTSLDTRCCSVKFQVPRPLTSAQEERGPSARGSLLGLTGKIRF